MLSEVPEGGVSVRFLPAPSLLLAVTATFLAGCGGDGEGGSSPLDTTPPAQVVDLAFFSVADTSVVLTWTAPGDDDMSGTASEYDCRHWYSYITQANWDSIIQIDGEPSPSPPGSREFLEVTGLAVDSTYCFGLKTCDEVPNWSLISNIICTGYPVWADLSLSKEVDNRNPECGEQVTFTITVTNSGPHTATGVTVSDLIPSGFAYVSDTGNGAYDNTSGMWDIGTIYVNESDSLRIIVTVLTSGDYRNIAQVETADQEDSDSVPGNDDETEDDWDYAETDS